MSDEVPVSQPGLVFGPGSLGWWDSERVSGPQILHEVDGTWKMWYYGRDATFDRMIGLQTGRVGLAVSQDGIAWERVHGPLTMGSVLDPVADTVDRFDNAHVGVSNVCYESGLFWMWYFGGDQTTVNVSTVLGTQKIKGLHMCPGCAISHDGVNWTRLEGPYRGAFLERGSTNDWDALYVGWPQVLKDDDGSYKMYYHSYSASQNAFVVGVAISEDSFRWNKIGQILGPGKPGSFDEMGPSCRHVLKIDDRYVMFYESPDFKAYYSIGLAFSDDGITWWKDEMGDQPGGPVFCHAPKGSGRWDALSVGTPHIVPLPDGSYRMYYVGGQEGGGSELGTKAQIGMAVSDGPNFRRWRRWNE